ncbi:MAG: adenine phosphoribosyltransferase [Bdellovibrionaceae bacterium]|nr:adenine phosphoribosyltransferase [Pseudobdellovibrionaceae bacterium]MBX3035006.1 adenine phosphoribosyltransferase [Pseudobdellovibrionaceae bacterium]
MDLKKLIRDIPDFPRPGILFRDITPLLKDPAALRHVAEKLVEGVDLRQVDHVAGIESRGFILGMLLAAHHGKGFLPIRKAGKLPPPTVGRSYALEYGESALELNPGSGRVLVVDDVLATGGTLRAAIELCEEAGYEVKDAVVLINLTFLNDMKFEGRDISSVIRY